jgi:hypothetical protein
MGATTLPSASARHDNSRLTRWWRGFRWDDNPVRRSSDRRETAVVAVLLSLFLVLAPAAAVAVGHMVHTAATERAAHQLTGRTLVTATVHGVSRAVSPYAPQRMALASWTAPNGKRVTGTVFVSPANQFGTTVRTWVTEDGQPAAVPMTRTDINVETVSSVLAAICVLAGLLTLVGWGLHRRLRRSRQQEWDRAWAYTEPLWSGRRR